MPGCQVSRRGAAIRNHTASHFAELLVAQEQAQNAARERTAAKASQGRADAWRRLVYLATGILRQALAGLKDLLQKLLYGHIGLPVFWNMKNAQDRKSTRLNSSH